MKFNCPSCNENCITIWQKAWADRFLPGKCVNCGTQFYKPIAPQMKYLFWALLIALPVIAAAIYYRQAYLLFLNIPILFLAFWVGLVKTPILTKK